MKRTLFGLGAAAATLGMAVAGLAAPAAAAPRLEAPEVKIKDVKLDGTGCKPGTATVVMSNHNTAMDILFNDFVVNTGRVTMGNGTTPWTPKGSKNCIVNLKLEYPSGWTFAVTSATMRGYANLAPRTTGKQITTYFFAGMRETGKDTADLVGPHDDVYNYTDNVSSPAWSECGGSRAFNMNSRVASDATNSARDTSSMITLDSKSVNVATKFNYGWKNC